MPMWTQPNLHACLENGKLIWRKHALERMLECGITRAEVKDTLRLGELIEQYEDDRPFPSALLGKAGVLPLHVVVALDIAAQEMYIVTALSTGFNAFRNRF
jgi:hypothetical protein